MSDEKPKCYLCGKDRDNHEVGCVEQLIVSDVLDEAFDIVASSLGIAIGTNDKDDEVIAFLFRRPTQEELAEDEDLEVKYTMSSGRNASHVVMRLLGVLMEQLNSGDVTLIPQSEALERARVLVDQ